MKILLNVFGTIALAVGLMAVAGSANDCDGKCMEYANTLGEMMVYAMIGLTVAGVGAFTLMSAIHEEG